MLYLQRKTYLGSVDGDGVDYCGRQRTTMLASYWFTIITGVVALSCIAIDG